MTTQAERQKAYRARKRDRRKAPEANALTDFVSLPFCDWPGLAAHEPNWAIPLDNAGLDSVRFDDDSGPASKCGLLEQAAAETGTLLPVGSLGRAELTIGSLIDAATALATAINEYKREQLAARRNEIDRATDYADPQAREETMRRIFEIAHMEAQLGRQVRWTFPQWKVTGE